MNKETLSTGPMGAANMYGIGKTATPPAAQQRGLVRECIRVGGRDKVFARDRFSYLIPQYALYP
jgi:hypothetical protein